MDGRHAARRLPAPADLRALVLAATPAMIAGVEVMAVLAAVAVATTAAVALALRARAVPARPTPGRWPRAIAAGAIGLGLGLMLVLDRTVGFTEGAVPALALLPSTVASAWGGYHLRHLEQAIPRSVSGIAAGDPYARAVAWPPFSVLLGALGRLLLLAAALSLVLLALTPWLGRAPAARACWPASAWSRWRRCSSACWRRWAAGAGRWSRSRARRGRGGVRVAGSDPFPGTGLVVGGSLAVLLVLPAVIGQLIRPGPHPGHRPVDPMSGTARRQRGLLLASAAAAGAILLVDPADEARGRARGTTLPQRR